MLCCCIGCMNGTECLNDVCPEPWKGFDLVQKKFLTPNLESWSICLTCKNFLSTDNVNYWTEHIDKLSSITLFTDLIQYIQWNPLPPLQANINNVMTENDKQFLDFVALHYIPNDAPDSYVSVAIVGDGNCFPRSVSYALFQTQECHAEIHTRIIYESVNNIDTYLDNAYLQMGTNYLYHRGTLAQQYAMYSDNYQPDRVLDVTSIYKQEVLDICQEGAYMGIWQIFQAASVVQTPIRSVYPMQTNPNIQKDLNRIVWCQ